MRRCFRRSHRRRLTSSCHRRNPSPCRRSPSQSRHHRSLPCTNQAPRSPQEQRSPWQPPRPHGGSLVYNNHTWRAHPHKDLGGHLCICISYPNY
nr:unnamed protein product [Digitaria exilis]